MSAESVAYVLGLLRRLKSTPNLSLGSSTISFLHEWLGSQSELEVARMVMAIQENILNARDIIRNSELSEEAQIGLLQTLSALQSQFSINSLNQAPNQFIQAIDPAITNFAIISSLIKIKFGDDVRKEVGDFIDEISNFINTLDGYDLPESVGLLARRHLRVLVAMLNNMEAVGVNCAISAYYDMLLALRREVPQESTNSSDGKSFWDQVKTWSGRFDLISGLFEKAQQFLPYLPELPRIAGY